MKNLVSRSLIDQFFWNVGLDFDVSSSSAARPHKAEANSTKSAEGTERKSAAIREIAVPRQHPLAVYEDLLTQLMRQKEAA